MDELNKKPLEYIQKLERRIHNQRVALRENWMIIDERFAHKSHYLKPRWFEKVKTQSQEIRELKCTIQKSISKGEVVPDVNRI